MPALLREGSYRFYVVSGDRDEPPHVHVRRDRAFAKFWLVPVKLQSNGHFRNRELLRIQTIVEQNHEALLRAWYDYFNG